MYWKLSAVGGFFIFLTLTTLIGLETTPGLWIKQWLTCLPWFDKGLHFSGMTLLTYLINKAVKNRCLNPELSRLLFGNLLVMILITIEESSQVFIPSRSFEWMDMISNYAGIFTGSWLSGVFSVKIKMICRATHLSLSHFSSSNSALPRTDAQ